LLVKLPMSDLPKLAKGGADGKPSKRRGSETAGPAPPKGAPAPISAKSPRNAKAALAAKLDDDDDGPPEV
jgi:hypothetical protein